MQQNAASETGGAIAALGAVFGGRIWPPLGVTELFGGPLLSNFLVGWRRPIIPRQLEGDKGVKDSLLLALVLFGSPDLGLVGLEGQGVLVRVGTLGFTLVKGGAPVLAVAVTVVMPPGVTIHTACMAPAAVVAIHPRPESVDDALAHVNLDAHLISGPHFEGVLSLAQAAVVEEDLEIAIVEEEGRCRGCRDVPLLVVVVVGTLPHVHTPAIGVALGCVQAVSVCRLDHRVVSRVLPGLSSALIACPHANKPPIAVRLRRVQALATEGPDLSRRHLVSPSLILLL